MNVLAIIFFIIFIIVTIIAIIYFFTAYNKEGREGGIHIFLWGFVPTLIVWLLNLYAFPGKVERYVPQTGIAASVNPIDPTGSVARTNLRVGEPFYLQIRIAVDSNSFARRFFHDDIIPFRVEISNPELASFVLERSTGFEEYKDPESDNSRTTYFFNVLAKDPEDNYQYAIINFKGEAKAQGSQQIRIIFDGKVSGTYSRTESFEYN